MQKIISINCPKCNHNQRFYKYGKDKNGFQKYLCRECNHQFTMEKPSKSKKNKYPPCVKCGKATFLHHDYAYYSNYRCGDKKCNHSMFYPKQTVILPSSVSNLFGKNDLKGMRFPLFVIISVLTQFYIGKSSTRDISLILKMTQNINVSHVTIASWCKKFAPIFHRMSLDLQSSCNLTSDEWHIDETVVKINGVKHYIWFIIDSETRFVLGYHLSKSRESKEAHSLYNEINHINKPNAIVSDRYSAYNIPTKTFFPNTKHIKVETFKDAISNNVLESFNGTFKSWYKTKRGFCDFHSANACITVFVFYYNFIRPHLGLNNLTPAQVAGCNYNPHNHNIFALAT